MCPRRYINIYTFFLFLLGALDSDVLLVLHTGVTWVPNKNAALIVDFEAIDSRRADRRCSKWSNVSKSFKSDGYRWEWLDPVVWYDRSWDFFQIKTLFLYVFVGGVRFLLMSFWETVLPCCWFAIFHVVCLCLTTSSWAWHGFTSKEDARCCFFFLMCTWHIWKPTCLQIRTLR